MFLFLKILIFLVKDEDNTDNIFFILTYGSIVLEQSLALKFHVNL